MSDIQRATVRQLAYKLKATGNTPRFAFFLGAGASRQSGIITAGEMIRYFKQQIIEQQATMPLHSDQEKESWLRAQPWFMSDDSDYSKFFNQYEPKEMGRQRYIESMIEGKKPSFGYVVLANLMASGKVNTIITTNFDDLVYNACTTYTDIRPVVYAYGVLASEIRITSQRPKIVKLHGDYLYSKLKNTDRETASQDQNMARQVRTLLNEYGLIVVGYSGNDKSVMGILDNISESNDFYWCLRKGEKPNETVTKLLDEKGGFLVEIDGFDEMMNEVRHIVGFDAEAMIGSIQKRQQQIIEQFKTFEPQFTVEILHKTADILQSQNRRRQSAASLQLQAMLSELSGKQTDAEANYRQIIEHSPDNVDAYKSLGKLLAQDRKRVGEAETMYRKAIELEPKNPHHYDALVSLLRQQHRDQDALPVAEKWLQVDPDNLELHFTLALMHKQLGHTTEAEHYVEDARALVKADDHYNIARLEALEGRNDEALEQLQRAAQSPSFNRDTAQREPVFEGLRLNAKFRELVS
jgi:tetratricopeptide (TPR) repeat protein